MYRRRLLELDGEGSIEAVETGLDSYHSSSCARKAFKRLRSGEEGMDSIVTRREDELCGDDFGHGHY